MTDELIKRLREFHELRAPIPSVPSIATEAADLIEQQAAALEAANARIAELEADRDAMMSALAECRDAMPIPDAGAPIEGHWASAMADPLEVPGYIRAALAQPLEAQADARDAQLEAALRHIAEQEHIELMLDPTWAQRIAIAALSQKGGDQE